MEGRVEACSLIENGEDIIVVANGMQAQLGIIKSWFMHVLPGVERSNWPSCQRIAFRRVGMGFLGRAVRIVCSTGSSDLK